MEDSEEEEVEEEEVKDDERIGRGERGGREAKEEEEEVGRDKEDMTNLQKQKHNNLRGRQSFGSRSKCLSNSEVSRH